METKYPIINYKGFDYPYREVHVFKDTDKARRILVSVQRLCRAIAEADDFGCEADNMFAGYVPPSVFYDDEDKLVKWVEKNICKNEP